MVRGREVKKSHIENSSGHSGRDHKRQGECDSIANRTIYLNGLRAPEDVFSTLN